MPALTLIARTTSSDTSSGGGVDWLATVWDGALHLLLIAGILASLNLLRAAARRTPDRTEQLVRKAAMFLGALAAVVAVTAGASYTEFITSSLAAGRTGTYVLLGVLAPALAGGLIASWIVRVRRSSTAHSVRFLLLVGALGLSQFVISYLTAIDHDGLRLGAAIGPNVSFGVGLLVPLIVFFHHPGDGPPRDLFGSAVRAIDDRRRGPVRPIGADDFESRNGPRLAGQSE